MGILSTAIPRCLSSISTLTHTHRSRFKPTARPATKPILSFRWTLGGHSASRSRRSCRIESQKIGDTVYLSFAWTSIALVTGNKTVTRRQYSDQYLRRFRKGTIVDAYDKLPRNHGVKIARILLTEKGMQESDLDIPDADYEGEGFKFLDEMIANQHERITTVVRSSFGLPPGRTLQWMFTEDKKTSGYFETSSVIRFELVDVTVAGIALAERFGVKAWSKSSG